MLPTKGMFTGEADIKPFLAVVKVTHREVQVADTAPCRILLACHMTIMLKQFAQRLDEVLKLGGTGMRALYSGGSRT